MHQKMLQGMNFGPSSAWYTIIILLLKKILTCNILWCIVYIIVLINKKVGNDPKLVILICFSL